MTKSTRGPESAPVVIDMEQPPSPRETADLNAVRSVVLRNQEGATASAALFVDEHGNFCLVGPDTTVRMPERLTRVTEESFYAPDLNQIAATIRANQRDNQRDPSKREQQIYVDNHGDIHSGRDVDGRDGRLTRMTQETFYAPSHLAADRETVERKLPPGTYFASDGTYEGWVYAIDTEFDDRFDLFLWRDPADGTYKVSLVEPRLGGEVGVHDCHLYDSGELCLRRAGGYARLEDAYARSALWARGASCYLRGYGFQFNVDQD